MAGRHGQSRLTDNVSPRQSGACALGHSAAHLTAALSPSLCPLTASARFSAQRDAGPGGHSRLLSDDRGVGAAWTKAGGRPRQEGPQDGRAERPRVQE